MRLQTPPTRQQTSKPARLILKRGKAKPVWAGHPWIYSGAIERIEGHPDDEPGGLIQVCDDRGGPIGVGTYHPKARIAVRMLARALPDGGVSALVKDRIHAARALRKRFGLPNDETNAYRLINGEGDSLPGLICDVLGDLAAVQITTAGAERWLPVVMETLSQWSSCVHVHVPADSARMENIPPGERLGRGDFEEHIPLLENGLSWNLRPGRGQKTGFYTDQRENRRMVRDLAGGGTVLDCFCYTGGFALNAARGGATEVIGVDSSGPAVSVAAGTAKNNDISNATFHKEDVMRYLKSVGDQRYDMVILDPPKLAKGKANLDDAYLKYRAINVAGIQHVTPGGLLVTCSCSGMVDEDMFLRMITDAARLANRRALVHRVSGAGPDHVTPAAFREGRYLTVVLATITE